MGARMITPSTGLILPETCWHGASPATVLDKLVWLHEVVGDFGTLVMTAHEWHDVEIDKRSMRLLAEEVMHGSASTC